jgi:hypothetical protein
MESVRNFSLDRTRYLGWAYNNRKTIRPKRAPIVDARVIFMVYAQSYFYGDCNDSKAHF